MYLGQLILLCLVLLMWSPPPGSAEKGQPKGTPTTDSLRQYILDYLHASDETVVRPYLLSYAASYDTSEGPVAHNISLDISGCENSAHLDTVTGPHTYNDGTTNDEATVHDILSDLSSVTQRVRSRRGAEIMYARHLLVVAQMAQRRSNDLLDNHLLCKSSSPASNGETVHSELRHLLWGWPEISEVEKVATEYVVILVASTVAGALGGVIIGLGAAYNIYISGPDPRSREILDESARSAISGFGAVLTGIPIFAPEGSFVVEVARNVTEPDSTEIAEAACNVTEAAERRRVALLQARNTGILRLS